MTEAASDIETLVAEIRSEAQRRRDQNEIPAGLENELEESFRRFVPRAAPARAREGLREAIERAQSFAFVSHHVQTVSARPVIGPLIGVFKRIIKRLVSWYVAGVAGQTRDFASASLHAMRVATDRIEELERQQEEFAERSKLTEDLQEKVYEIWERVESLRLEDRLGRMERMLRFLGERIDAGSPATAPVPAAPETPGRSPDSERPAKRAERAFDYYLFQAAHRGGPEALEERTRRYLPYFKDAQDVLDFGCGSGEFLQALGEAGIRAYGIDIHPEMVAACREKGLEAVEGDGIDHLRRLEPESLGGIFLGQVVEHLDPQELVALVELSYDALRPGGVFLAETVNPTCLGVFSHAFYIDLSHTKPVHPTTMGFLLESTGYRGITYEWLFPFSEEARLSELQGDEPWAAALNENIEKLNKLLYGFHDYAVIGRKQ